MSKSQEIILYYTNKITITEEQLIVRFAELCGILPSLHLQGTCTVGMHDSVGNG